MRKLPVQNENVRGTAPCLGTRIPMCALIQCLAVAEHLSFRHAAAKLGVSQSSVSARIKALEDELGILLFERNTRGVRLSVAGRHFVERLAEGIDKIDNAVRTAGMVARGEYGCLRIGVHALISGGFLADLLIRHRALHPGVEVEIAEGTAHDAVMQLRNGRLDMVFVLGFPDLPDCNARTLWSEPVLAALPSGHFLAGRRAVAWDDLARETFLVRQSGAGPQVHDHIVLRLAGRLPAPEILRIDVERASLLSMVAQGFGVAVVTATTTLLRPGGVAFLPILDEPERFMFSAVWSPHNRNPAIKNMLDLAGKIRRQRPEAN